MLPVDGRLPGRGRRQLKMIPVTLAERLHPFPSRTRKLSSPAPKILGGPLPGKIGRRRGFHFSILVPVDRLCPFLALQADHRTAVDGYDPDHACHALTPPEPLDRARQEERTPT